MIIPRQADISSHPTIVRTFKAAITRRVGRELNATGIWQKNYGAYLVEPAEGNISFATTKIGIESIGTLKPIRPCGRKTMKIH